MAKGSGAIDFSTGKRQGTSLLDIALQQSHQKVL